MLIQINEWEISSSYNIWIGTFNYSISLCSWLWILVGDVYLIQYIKILSLLMACTHLPLGIIALRRKYGTSCLCICFYYYKVFSIVIDNVFQIFSSDTFTIILFWIDFTFTVVGGV